MIRSRLFARPLLFLLLAAGFLHAQRLAIISPASSEEAAGIERKLEQYLAAKHKLIDRGSSDAAFRAMNFQKPFNLSADEAQRATAAIGCEYMLIVRIGTQRRASFSRPDYFEAFAVMYLVSARTGRLASWKITSREGDSARSALEGLSGSISELAGALQSAIADARVREVQEPLPVPIIKLPYDGVGEKGLKPPVPYKRIKPEYTQLAYLYDVEATVEVEVDITATGEPTNINVVRWAGYGLDEAVVETVRTMNWRPAERGGVPLPMRILLRYNFTDIEED